MNAVARDVHLARRFREVRSLTGSLCETLSPEDCSAQSMPDASPSKWHLAHTTWFFETFVLRSAIHGYDVYHPSFEVLFNSYYNSVGEQYSRPDRGLLTRPSFDDVTAYRDQVETDVLSLLESPGRLDEAQLDIVELGLHHEQQHQELLLTDVKHLLAQNPLAPIYRSGKESTPAVKQPLAWHAYPGGLVATGHEETDAGFAFDNESPRHQVYLQPFELGSRPTLNGEFAAFIDDGGYARPEFWLSEGWAMIQEEGIRAPLYWTRDDPHDAEGWSTFTLSGCQPVCMEEPVCHVSFFEADAFARWSKGRLPTEAEWEVAASETAVEGNFLEGGRFHPEAAPVSTAEGVPAKLYGDVWEWTSSAYTAYPGYRPAAGALGEYNGKFMSSQIVLKGGSCVSPRSHLRASYRNFFPPSARWQFSGIRLARDASHQSGGGR